MPSRALLIVAGLLTQLLGAACLVLALASIPIVHDLHGGTKAALASVIAALAALEHILGGDAIRKVFGRIRATVHLHDAVRVGAVGAHGGWGAANVDFTDADRDGTDVTQTFRVLAAWVQEDAGWRIVQTQWSNAR